MTLTFLVRNYDDDDINVRGDLDRAKTWEKGFVEFMKNYTSGRDKPVWMDVAYTSERSIEDELDRTSRGDVVTIAVSYVFMLLYIIVSLGNVTSGTGWRRVLVEKKVVLSLFGVVLVLLSVVAAVGFFGFVGIPSTLITFQILPFLVRRLLCNKLFKKYFH